MPPKKFTDTQLNRLLRRGLTCSEAARRLGVSRSTVSERLKALKIAVSKAVTLRSASEIVRKELDTIGQLQKINRDANELLDLLMRGSRGNGEAWEILEKNVRKPRAGTSKTGVDHRISELECSVSDARQLPKDPRELALKAMQEIRGQLKLQLEMFQALFDIQAVQQFQSEVLEVIGNVSPEARDEIIRRLTEKSALRSALDLN